MNLKSRNLNHKKSQTATEYLIILAVVIVIALLVVGILGGIPSIGGGAGSNSEKAVLMNDDVGVVNYAIVSNKTMLSIRNNKPDTVKVNSIWVEKIPCSLSDDEFPMFLNAGQKKLVNCVNLNS
ncbi:MAG: hypothetical protein ACQER9_01970, partial [Nanobdellota archaeon]